MKTFYFSIIVLTFSCLHVNAQTWQWTHPEANPDINSNNYAHDVEVDSSGNVYALGMYGDSLFLDGNFITPGTGSYLAKYNSAGALLWYKLFNNPDGKGLIYASDMVVNAQGIFVTGSYSPPSAYSCSFDCTTGQTSCAKPSYNIGNLNFNSQFGQLGFFLTKFNTNGSVAWNKLANSTATLCDLPFVANIFGLGGQLGRPVLTSDKSGNITVAFIAGSYDGVPHSISIDGDNIPLDNTSTANELVAVKYKPTGVLQFSAHTNAGNGVRDCNSIIADNNGNIFLYGAAVDSTYFGSQLFRGSTPPASDGNYYQSTYIAKLSSKGVWLFVKELSDVYSNAINAAIVHATDYANPDLLAVDDNNNVYALVNGATTIFGDTSVDKPNYNNFLVKMTNNGNLVWAKLFSGNNGTGVTTTYSISYFNNSLYLNGLTASSPLFSDLYVPLNAIEGCFVAKADLNGNFKWVNTFSADGRMWGTGVKAYQDNIYTCGTYYYDIATLGNLNGTKSNTGNYKIFFGKLKDQYISVGAITPTALIPGCTISIPFTSYGLTFSAKNKFFAELSDVNGDFTSVTPIGNVSSTGSGTITATIPSTLTYSTGYRVRIRSSDTLITGLNYYAYADTGYALTLTCPAPSSGFSTTNITGNSVTLNWNIVDCAKGYKLQYKVKGPGAWTTVLVNSNTGSINLTGLIPNTTYQWHIAAKCKSSLVVFSDYSANKNFTTASAFAANNPSIDNNSAQTKTSSIAVYPNPANNNAVVQFTSNKTGKYTLQIKDVSGKVLQTKNGTSVIGKNNVTIDLSRYAQGMYMLNLTDDEHGKRTLQFDKE